MEVGFQLTHQNLWESKEQYFFYILPLDIFNQLYSPVP